MNLYLLKRPEEDVYYDETDSQLVAADTQEEAVELASERGWGDAGNNPKLESISNIGVAAESVTKGVLLISYNAA